MGCFLLWQLVVFAISHGAFAAFAGITVYFWRNEGRKFMIGTLETCFPVHNPFELGVMVGEE